MSQQLAIELLAREDDLSAVVREYAHIVTADARAQREEKQRAAQEAYEQSCRELREWIERYLPRFFDRVAAPIFEQSADPKVVRWVSVRVGEQVRFARIPGYPPSLLVTVLSRASQPEMRITLTEDTLSNWALLVPALVKLTGAIERAEEGA